ncbi:PKD domain-containing protein [Streptomyces sp. V1I1]|uniref:PKD domain-containing protein n=1 Tax=Streptomyces sp. V1I1 TaxID=3042272 RepID=UPI00277FE228|nr:PKD domain-containing protein [Streptomyces sp. V1I1]MDQ0945563.1 PKD repeat protein [Streptomyces sp. V1I1]
MVQAAARGPRALLGVPKDAPVGSAVRLTVTVDGRQPAAGYRYRWHFGDGTQQETSESSVTHAYGREGPYLPRLVVTAEDGRPVLTEAAHTVTVS